MDMKKKWISGLLAASMLLMLASCGETEETGTETPAGVAVQTEEVVAGSSAVVQLFNSFSGCLVIRFDCCLANGSENILYIYFNHIPNTFCWFFT